MKQKAQPNTTTDPGNVGGLYYMRPPEVNDVHPSDDHKYGNGVSLCLYLRHNRHSIWICGDITPEVHEEVLLGPEKGKAATKWLDR